MTTARKEIVDPAVTRWYHCISRCVRRAMLMGEGLSNRKQWIENRLQFLNDNFAIAVGGFAVLDNHLHLLARLDPHLAENWSDQETARRWLTVYTPKTLDLESAQSLDAHVQTLTKNPTHIAELRKRLTSLSWFMKALKEPLSRLANQEDNCRGTFWEQRFKSIAILDEEALLATSIYVDLNVFAAGLAETPESSPHTSVQQRVASIREQGKLADLHAARQGSVAGSNAAGDLEGAHWLVPIEDRRAHTNASPTSEREGMLESLSLGSYLMLIDHTCRLGREGKAKLTAGTAEIFQRLGTTAEAWSARMKGLLGCCDLRGSFYAGDPAKVREQARRCGKRRANLSLRFSSG
jgi:hypothetical protein